MQHPLYPRASKYDAGWVIAHQMGPNALWLLEWLCEGLRLSRGMRVLDMGCGKALTSIFLARELGVQVWANDLWIAPSENWQRIRAAGVGDRVFPIRAEASALPYAEEFFDAVVSVDAYHYFGTEEAVFATFARLVPLGGRIGIVVPGTVVETDGRPPAHLADWEPEWFHLFRTAAWWRRLWEGSGLAEVEIADTLAEGWRDWTRFTEAVLASGTLDAEWTASTQRELEKIREDAGRTMGFVRVVARRVG